MTRRCARRGGALDAIDTDVIDPDVVAPPAPPVAAVADSAGTDERLS
ncbi:hypothetical protein [Microbacterium proteolyticum]|nr:hypothetical protein [Microbacterium proteolyticum]MCI9859059.1 hypothetical protein [Microbacterium proteolyticum]